MHLTRRQALAGGGALLAIAWVGVHVFGHRPLPTVDSPCLGAPARRTLEAALDALLPDPAAAPAIAAATDAFLAAGDPVLAAQLRLALRVLEHLGGATPLSPLRFSRRDRAARVAILRSWEGSAVATKRHVFQALRRTAAFAFYSDPARWAETGYDGPWVGRIVPPEAAP